MPVITLTTDFGTKDYYVSAMKGVILRIHPQAQIVDITHDIPDYDIMGGAYILKSVYENFPEGTIHVAVIDPGVGSDRRGIIVKVKNHFFVGPDNGLFSLIAEGENSEAVEISNPKFWNPAVSSTFHGRDIFAPVAAHLANGTDIHEFGNKIDGITQLTWGKPTTGENYIHGIVLHIDKFCNIISNITREEFECIRKSRSFIVQIRNAKITKIHQFYSETEPGDMVCLFGSSGFMEISVNQGHASKLLGMSKNDPVFIEFK